VGLSCVDLEETRLLVSEGKSVELECRKPRTDNPTIAVWKYRKSAGQAAVRLSYNRRIKLGLRTGRYSVKALNDSEEGMLDFSLMIRRVSRYDEGSYTCLIADQTAETRHVVHLDVAGLYSVDCITPSNSANQSINQ